MNNRLTTAEAAAFIGKSTRAIQRYATAGKLTPHQAPGKTNPITVYDEAELILLKEELENPGMTRIPPSDASTVEPSAQALATTRRNESLAEFAAIISEAIAAHTNPPRSTPLADKLMLSLPECSELSGISVEKLRQAVSAGKLTAIKNVGRGHGKVKRDDLNDYVKKLK